MTDEQRNRRRARDGVALTNLDQPLFDGAGATKRDLVDYLDAVHDRILPVLADRPLSVIRVHRGQDAFMQKNVPRYTPDWVRTVQWWAESSKRMVSYALCDDRRTLLWFANQRAVEYHPDVGARRAPRSRRPTWCSTSIRPRPTPSRMAVRAARAVRQALDEAGLAGAVKTSGSKGLHVFVPIEERVVRGVRRRDPGARRSVPSGSIPTIATTAFVKADRDGKVFVDSTRVGGATVVAAYSPRIRPGVPVSFPFPWDDLEHISARPTSPSTPRSACSPTAIPGRDLMPAPQRLPADLVEEGHAIPVARVQAMHEGKRRARAVASESTQVARYRNPISLLDCPVLTFGAAVLPNLLRG